MSDRRGGVNRRDGGGGYRPRGGYRDDRRHGGEASRQRGGHEQQRGRPFQPSHIGHKRPREGEEQQQRDPKAALAQALLSLGAVQSDKDSPARSVEGAVKLVKQAIAQQVPGLAELLADAAVSAVTRTTHLALLIGLLHAEQEPLVGQVVAMAASRLGAALASGARLRARLLLRFAGALAAAGVLAPASVVALMQSLVGAAGSYLSSGSDPTGRTWQPWADHLVGCVVTALPWCGSALAAGAPAAAQQLLDSIGAYVEGRPMQEDPELRPLYGAASEDDLPARSDSGAASFVREAWRAVRRCADDGWAVAAVPPPALGSDELEQLIAMAVPLDLPEVAVPLRPHTEAALADQEAPVRAAALLQAYPPHGGLSMLLPQHTDAGRPPVEGLVVRGYVADVLEAYDGHRREQAELLAKGLLVPYGYEGYLVEALFGQMFVLPQPPLKVLAYCSLINDVCRLLPTFPKYMSAYVRECFTRMPFLDPLLRARLAEFLALHISNFYFAWPWAKWGEVVGRPPTDPQRAFCAMLLQRLQRLSFHEQLVQQVLPPEWAPMLGPEPKARNADLPTLPFDPTGATFKAGGEEGAAADTAAGDAAAGGDASDAVMADAGEGAANGGAAAAPPEAPRASGGGGGGRIAPRERRWAARILAALRHRAAPEDGADAAPAPLSGEALVRWMEETGAERDLGGPGPLLRAWYLALLAAGVKSHTHTCVALERYAPQLRAAISAAGEAAARELLDVTDAVWGEVPQKMVLVLDRLLTLRYVSTASVVSWVFTWRGLTDASQLLQGGPAWEVLYLAVSKAAARVTDVGEDLAAQQAALASATADASAAEAAAAEAAEAEAEGGDGDGGRRVSRAAREEQAARARAAAASEALASLEGALEANLGDREVTLLTAYRCLVAWVGPAPPAGGAAGGEAADGEDATMADAEASHASARQLRLAHLRAFARTFFFESAELVEDLTDDVAAPGAAPADVRRALLGALRLPLGDIE